MSRVAVTILLVFALVLASAWRVGHAAPTGLESCCASMQTVAAIEAVAAPGPNATPDTAELPCCARQAPAAEAPATCGDHGGGCPAGENGKCPCECCKVAPSLPLLAQQAPETSHQGPDAAVLLAGEAWADSRDLRPPSPPPKCS